MRIIAGRWGGRKLRPLRGGGTRPTTDRVREAWFSVLAPELPGARVLDLFAGSGALGLEALSRGAASAVLVERSSRALRTLRENVALLGAEEEAEVVRGDALGYLDGLEPEEPDREEAGAAPFDLALADPPYGRGLAALLLERFQRRPFARSLWVEHRSDEELPDLAGLRHRRYGDTTLTSLSAP